MGEGKTAWIICTYVMCHIAATVARKVNYQNSTPYNSLHSIVRNWVEVRAEVNGPAPAEVVAATLHKYLVYGFKLVRLKASD